MSMKGGGRHARTSLLSVRRKLFSSGQLQQGYTIVEVMVFLAITAVMFAMIVGTFSTRQGRTQFTQDAREMESRFQDIINDVTTGFYPNRNNFQCLATGTGPQIVPGVPNEQGTNNDCIFLGRVAHFNVTGSNGRQYNIYSVAGLRNDSSTGRDVDGFDEARPRVIDQSTETIDTPGGLTIRRLEYRPSGGGAPVSFDAIGFFSSFGSYSGSKIQSGAATVRAVPLPLSGGGAPGSTAGEMSGYISSMNDATVNLIVALAEGTITVCMDSNTSNQHAELTLGGYNRRLATDLAIRENLC